MLQILYRPQKCPPQFLHIQMEFSQMFNHVFFSTVILKAAKSLKSLVPHMYLYLMHMYVLERSYLHVLQPNPTWPCSTNDHKSWWYVMVGNTLKALYRTSSIRQNIDKSSSIVNMRSAELSCHCYCEANRLSHPWASGIGSYQPEFFSLLD